MERALIEYLANSLWQLPLLAGGAWLLLRIARPEPRTQHWVWIAVLAAAAVLPLRGIEWRHSATASIQPRIAAAPMTMNSDWIVSASDTNAARHAGEGWMGFSGGVRGVPLSGGTMDGLAVLYLLIVIFGAVRFGWRWRAARRLVKVCQQAKLPEETLEVFHDCGRRLGVDLPELRECGQVLSPVVVGAWKPMLLLPENFSRRNGDEVKAALCHELAHIRRRDYAVNLLCQMTALPLVWHPAVHAVQQRIRSTREMACDDVAARAMRSEIGYARCLMSLAESMAAGNSSRQPQALGLFDNTLEERVMRLTASKTTMSARVKVARVAGAVAVMLAATAATAMFHVTPTLAKAQAASPAPPSAAHAPETPKEYLGIPGPTAIGHGKGASVIAGKGEYVHRWIGSDGKPFVIANHQRREPTPEERRRIERAFARQMDQMKVKVMALNPAEIQQQVRAATAQVNSPEFKKQMADIQRQVERATAQVNSPEFKRQMADMQRQMKAATVQINSPEFKKQMAEIQKQIENGELQSSAQMAKMKINMKNFKLPDIEVQMKGATSQLDSRGLEQEMAELQEAVRNGELQREKAIQILKDAQTQLEKMQTK